jgi:hypothetical protein
MFTRKNAWSRQAFEQYEARSRVAENGLPHVRQAIESTAAARWAIRRRLSGRGGPRCRRGSRCAQAAR